MHSVKGNANSEDVASSIDTSVADSSKTIKNTFKDASNQWMERNRSLVLRQTPVWAKSLITLLLSLGSMAVLGSIFIRVDEVITVTGQLKSIGGTFEVKTPAGGRIDKIFYEDGQLVQKGQLLIQFDISDAKQQQKTLVNLIKLEKANLLTQLSTIDSQKTSLKTRKSVLIKRLETKNTIIKDMEFLVKQGGFQRIQYMQALDERFTLESQLSEVKESEAQLNLRAEQIQNDTNQSLDKLNNELSKTNLQLQYKNVRAPMQGVVFDPQASVAGVLAPGERILSIVPQKGLFAEIYVPNSDIGFVDPGLETKVRVDAFPFTKYGEIPASVTQIGADALPPDQLRSFYSFPVKLNLKSSSLSHNDVKIPLKSGMAIAANLKLRDKPIISILSDLLVDQTDSVRNIRQQ